MPFKDLEAQKESQKKYNQSEKGKEARKRYKQSEKGKETRLKHKQSQKKGGGGAPLDLDVLIK